MAHSPLFAALRRSFRMARLASERDAPAIDELIALRGEASVSRRKFLRQVAATSALVAGSALTPGCFLPRRAGTLRNGPRVAIVGAGIAGLNAAYQLRRSGIRATIYEASARTGGRMFSSAGMLGSGIVTELGGEFIDSHHDDVLSLAKKFRLNLLDMCDSSESQLIQEAYFFGGRHYTEAEVVAAFQPLAERMDRDMERLDETIDYQHEGGAGGLDRMSVAEYLDQVGASGFIRKLLDVAYVTEYGLDAGEQSALNLLFLIGTDVSGGEFEAFGESDERYKIVGGNQRVVDELAARLDGQIELGQNLVAIEQDTEGVTLSFGSAGQSGVSTVVADYAVLTVPFTVLRDIEWRSELPALKRRVIHELGYGTNAKLFIGQETRTWQRGGYAGNIFSDEGFQLAWDNSRLQGTHQAALTLYSGGREGIEVGKGSAQEQVDRLLPGVDRAFPGVTEARHGAAQRFHWPTHPYTRGSYSCYRPGQWTTLAGAERFAVGNVLFAGEHCSRDFQGYMNGGAETGRRVAAELVAQVAATR